MKSLISKSVLIIAMISLIGCARDLSTNVYTSDATQSLTLEGKIVSARPVTVKGSDALGENAGGMIAGGVLGGVVGSTMGQGTGNTLATVGGAAAGAALGSLAQDKLSQSKGYEYIVKVDQSKLKSAYYEGNAAMRNAISTATTSGLITVVQGTDQIFAPGQKVYVIFSDNRTRVIAAN